MHTAYTCRWWQSIRSVAISDVLRVRLCVCTVLLLRISVALPWSSTYSMPLQEVQLTHPQLAGTPDDTQHEPGMEKAITPTSSTGVTIPSGTSSSYLSLLRQLHTHWADCPAINISYTDLSYVIRVPLVDQGVRNFMAQGWDKIRG